MKLKERMTHLRYKFVFVFIILCDQYHCHASLNANPNLLANIFKGVLDIPVTHNVRIPAREKRPRPQRNDNTPNFDPEALNRYKDELLRYISNEENNLKERLT